MSGWGATAVRDPMNSVRVERSVNRWLLGPGTGDLEDKGESSSRRRTSWREVGEGTAAPQTRPRASVVPL